MKFKTFLINMDKSKERLVFMSNQLDSNAISFIRQPGVDGKTYDFSDVYSDEIARKYNGSSLALVEKGCAMSHRLILEQAMNEELDYVLILEDDVELPGNFKEVIDYVLKERHKNKTDWEYLAFNYPTVGYKYMKLWFFLLSEQFKKIPSLNLYLKIPLYLAKGVVLSFYSIYEGLRNELYRSVYRRGKPAKFYRPIYLAGCYLVTKKGVAKLLEVQKGIIYPADRIQNIARIKNGLKLYHFVPLLVKQRRDKFESTMYENKDYVFSKYD